MKAISTVLLLALVGGLLGAALAFVHAAGLLMPWVRLPAPPQAAVRLLAAATPYVLIADGSDRLYLYQRFSDAWTPIDADQAAAYPNQAIAGPANHFMPAPPGGAVAVKYVLDPGQGRTVDYGAYALGQDGTVWDWFKTDSPAARRAGLLLPAIGAAIGLAAGLLVWLGRRLVTGQHAPTPPVARLVSVGLPMPIGRAVPTGRRVSTCNTLIVETPRWGVSRGASRPVVPLPVGQYHPIRCLVGDILTPIDRG